MSSPRKRHERKNGSSAIAVVIEEVLARQQRGWERSGLSEKDALVAFCQVFQLERSFSRHACRQSFAKLLRLLKSQRITRDWLEGGVSEDNVHTVLMALRLLLRDEGFQHKFMEEPSPVPVLAKSLAGYTQAHFTGGHDAAVVDILKELTNIFQKLSNSSCYGDRLVCEDVHVTLVQLLSSRELVPLQCALCALINICKSPHSCVVVGDLSCVPVLLHILQHYDTSSRHLASDLLLLLSHTPGGRAQVKDSDALPLCLRLLHSEDLHVLHRMVGVVERFAEDSELQDEIRLLGGIPLVLALLSKKFSSADVERTSQDKLLALRAACCSAITQLALNDSNTHHLVQGNGVYLLSSLILPQSESSVDPQLRENLQKYALRALRYLFSMERNRQLFKRVFPPHLFETFIDIGHYVKELSAYCPLMHMINTLPESEQAVIQTNIEATNQNKAPAYTIGNYAVFELLGSGAFGSVYKVKKNQTDVFLAMKEIKATHPCLGTNVAERGTSIGRLMNEVNIMREQLRHPNVVHYHKCFREGGHLYIIMELLEGAPLSEHITSLQEKGQRFTEQRIWKIFTQLVLALRYIHKEKQVIHRDLTPANLMLGEGDKLTITDFGLAKQKQREFSVMKSVVGTMLYWCPELVQNEPYNEKADIWAAGCILYQMATLHPPFHSPNLLALAKKIAEVEYEPIMRGVYSPLVTQVVQSCLTADPEKRPDSVQLGSLLAAPLMQQMDQLALRNEGLEKRLGKEKQRTIRHFHKAVWSEQRYQQLLSTSSGNPGNRDHPPVHESSPNFTALQYTHEDTTRTSGSELTSDTKPFPLSGGRLPPPHPGSDYPDTGVVQQLSHVQEKEGVSEGESTDGSTSDPEPLQRSSDSVFLDHIPDETNRLQYPGNDAYTYPHSQHLPNFGNFADTPPLARRLSKQNPLISRTNTNGNGVVRMRSQSDVVLGVGQLSLLQAGRGNRAPFAGSLRSQSAFVGGRGQPLGSGSLSPLSQKSRTPSASSILSISSRHLREISDPISQLMAQLHKLLFLTQLPPSPTSNIRRLLVDQYKHALFDRPSSPGSLKTEMHRLVTGANESVGVLSEGGEGGEGRRIGGLQSRRLQKALSELAATSTPQEIISPPDFPEGHQSITYDQLQAIVESLLVENGYYCTVDVRNKAGLTR